MFVVNSIQAPKVEEFDAVKADMKKTAMHDKVADALMDVSGAVDERFAAGDDLATVAKEMDLKTQELGPLRADGSTPGHTDAMKAFGQDVLLRMMLGGETKAVVEAVVKKARTR